MPSNPKKMAFISTQERSMHDINLYPLDWGYSVHVFLSLVPAFTTIFPFISGSRFLSVQSYGLLCFLLHEFHGQFLILAPAAIPTRECKCEQGGPYISVVLVA